MSPKRFLALLIAVWIAAQIGNILTSGYLAWSSISERFREQNHTVSETISIRLAHHEAILRSLQALMSGTRSTSDRVFRQVASDILSNYPRIDGIKIYGFGPHPYSPKPELLYEAPNEDTTLRMSVLDALTKQPTGQVQAYPAMNIPNHYLATMVSNGGQGLIGVVLIIDSTKLFSLPMETDHLDISLSIDDVVVLGDAHDNDDRHHHKMGPLSILKNILFSNFNLDRSGSRFKIHAHRPIELHELISLSEVINFALLSLTAVLGVYYGWYQTTVSQRSREAEEKAVRRSAILEHENRLSHAARVNQVGELASGIIHELTQPLSALLSQSQASIKILDKLEIKDDLLNRALSANVVEAKRAGQILGRIRDYIVKKPVAYEELDLNEVVSNTIKLLQSELDKQNVALDLQLSQPGPKSNFSAIELEQVIHNLIRNATDALATTSQPMKRITIKTDTVGSMNIIRISDNGPGLNDTVLSKIFEPFFTTKTTGMGLGLSLSSKLLERVGGTLHAASADGAVFTISLPKRVHA